MKAILLLLLAICVRSEAGINDYVVVEPDTDERVLHGENGTGHAGNILQRLVIVPLSTGAGDVDIKDGASTSWISVLEGGGTLADLTPIVVELQARSRTGAWRVNADSNVRVIAIGDFK